MNSSLAGMVALCAGTIGAFAGPLDPPPGPIASTYKTLQQIEPRVDANTLPGSTSAVIVIDRPGSYYLSADVQGQHAKHGIRISASPVTLDLNGFSIVGTSTSLNGIEVVATDSKIRNGTVHSFGGFGINGYYGGVRAILEDVTAAYNGESGFRIDGAYERCTAMYNDAVGFDVSYSVIRDSLAIGQSNDYGFWAAFGTLIESCMADSNLYGIRVEQGSRVRNSTSSYNSQDGFTILGESTAEDCTARRNSRNGFWSEGGEVKNCYALLNVATGIGARGNALVVNNTSEANAENFWFGGNALYGPVVTGGGDLSTIPGGSNPHANFSR